jgi:parvulin-like peptidyl-prolyl isomerase
MMIGYAEEKGLVISDDELDQALDDVKKAYSDAAFQEVLLKEYLDYESWKERLRSTLLMDKVMAHVLLDQPSANEEEIRQYYETNQEAFKRPEMVRFRQIVTNTEADAERVLRELQDGADMAEMAGKNSVSPEAENGGEVGWLAREHLEESMEKVLFSLKPGQVSPVTKTPYGYHIFEVLSIQAGQDLEYEDVRDHIVSEIKKHKQDAYLEDWFETRRKQIHVEINYDMLKKMELPL